MDQRASKRLENPTRERVGTCAKQGGETKKSLFSCEKAPCEEKEANAFRSSGFEGDHGELRSGSNRRGKRGKVNDPNQGG